MDDFHIDSPDRKSFIKSQLERLRVIDDAAKPEPYGPPLPSWWLWRHDWVLILYDNAAPIPMQASTYRNITGQKPRFSAGDPEGRAD